MKPGEKMWLEVTVLSVGQHFADVRFVDKDGAGIRLTAPTSSLHPIQPSLEVGQRVRRSDGKEGVVDANESVLSVRWDGVDFSVWSPISDLTPITTCSHEGNPEGAKWCAFCGEALGGGE